MLSIILAAAVIFIAFAYGVIILSRGSQENLTNFVFSTFIVQNPSLLDNQFFSELAINPHLRDLTLSFEVLTRGGDKALVFYAPQDISRHFPLLKLLEIEDYIFQLNPERDSALSLHSPDQITLDQPPLILANLALAPGDQLFWQVTLTIQSRAPDKPLINLRAIIKSADLKRLSELKNILISQLNTKLSLMPITANPSKNTVFDYQNRRLLPNEALNTPIENLTNLIRI